MCVRLALPIPLTYIVLPLCYALYDKGHPVVMYAPRGRGGQVSSTFPWRISITCKKGGREGVQITCKIM